MVGLTSESALQNAHSETPPSNELISNRFSDSHDTLEVCTISETKALV